LHLRLAWRRRKVLHGRLAGAAPLFFMEYRGIFAISADFRLQNRQNGGILMKSHEKTPVFRRSDA